MLIWRILLVCKFIEQTLKGDLPCVRDIVWFYKDYKWDRMKTQNIAEVGALQNWVEFLQGRENYKSEIQALWILPGHFFVKSCLDKVIRTRDKIIISIMWTPKAFLFKLKKKKVPQSCWALDYISDIPFSQIFFKPILKRPSMVANFVCQLG